MAYAYDKNANYKALMDEAAGRKDYRAAAEYERLRNDKIKGEGMNYGATSDYAGWLDDTDYSTTLHDLMGRGASSDEVASVLGQRTDKAKNTIGLTQYADDETAQAAKEYVANGGKKKELGEFNYGNAPEYVSRNQEKIDSLYEQIMGRPAFSYDPSKDQLYAQYADTYTREGQRAMADTIGEVAGRTGGLASSYAATAGAQANNHYMAQLSDKIPELQQLAYGMYQDEGNRQRTDLDMLMGMEQTEYGRYADSLNQYNANRNFDYGRYNDQWNRDYTTGRDKVTDERYTWEKEHGLAREGIEDGRYEDDKTYDRQQDTLDWAYQKDGDAYDRAMQRWQLTGSLDAEGAKILGLPVGTKTPDERDRMAQMVRSSTASSGRSGGTTSDNKEKISISSQVSNQVDERRGGTDWIRVPGYSRLTWAELELLVEKGEILESYDAKTGKYTYRKNNNYGR